MTAPTVVQNVAVVNSNAATSIVFNITAPADGNLLTVGGGLYGNYTGVTVTDNGTGIGTPNSWSVPLFYRGNSRFCFVARCLSIEGSPTQITATFTGGSGGVYGAAACDNVNVAGGAVWSDDKNGSAGFTPGVPNTVVVTSSAVDDGAADFVVGAASTGAGNSNQNLDDPPTGYTSAAYQPDDNTFACGEVCYRINSSAVQDTATWNCPNTTVGDPGILVSFKFTLSGPTINSQPGSVAIHDGDTASLHVEATTSGGALSYQWQDNRTGSFANVTDGTGGTAQDYVTAALATANSGRQYQCIVTDSNSSTTTAAATIRVDAATSATAGDFHPHLITQAWF